MFDPLKPRAYSGVPEPTEYATYQRRVAEAHNRTRALLAEAPPNSSGSSDGRRSRRSS